MKLISLKNEQEDVLQPVRIIKNGQLMNRIITGIIAWENPKFSLLVLLLVNAFFWLTKDCNWSFYTVFFSAAFIFYVSDVWTAAVWPKLLEYGKESGPNDEDYNLSLAIDQPSEVEQVKVFLTYAGLLIKSVYANMQDLSQTNKFRFSVTMSIVSAILVVVSRGVSTFWLTYVLIVIPLVIPAIFLYLMPKCVTDFFKPIIAALPELESDAAIDDALLLGPTELKIAYDTFWSEINGNWGISGSFFEKFFQNSSQPPQNCSASKDKQHSSITVASSIAGSSTAEPSTADPSATEPSTADPSTAEPSTAELFTAESLTAEPFTTEQLCISRDSKSCIESPTLVQGDHGPQQQQQPPSAANIIAGNVLTFIGTLVDYNLINIFTRRHNGDEQPPSTDAVNVAATDQQSQCSDEEFELIDEQDLDKK